MSYAIARMAKQKGSSVGSSSLHNSRQRETPNADPEREKENQVLIGGEKPTPMLVREIIEQHGGKPRVDSVEAVEVLLTASPEWFLDDNDHLDRKKVDQFCAASREFLLDRKNGGICVKADLHMDETSPHVQAIMVPIDPKGKLNCRHYFGERWQLKQWQTRFAECVKHLGLERGVEGSRATHHEVKDFYKAINREHRIKIDHDRLPDPPRIMTRAAAQKYKEELARAVIEQVKEPIQTQLHQAMLARDANGRLQETKKRLAERNQELSAEKIISMDLRNELERVRGQYQDLLPRVQKAETRVKDVSPDHVLKMSGYKYAQIRERGQVDYVKPEINQMMTLTAGGIAYDVSGNMIARDSVNLTRELLKREGKPSKREDAVGWLADKCGKEQAIAASLFEHERSTEESLHGRDLKRQRALSKPDRGGQEIVRDQQERVREHVREREIIHDRGLSR
jgi:hypothetical protein